MLIFVRNIIQIKLSDNGINSRSLRRPFCFLGANYMQSDIAPWLTIKQCIDRVKWCISLFHAKVYMVLQDEIAKERIGKGVEIKNISKIT